MRRALHIKELTNLSDPTDFLMCSRKCSFVSTARPPRFRASGIEVLMEPVGTRSSLDSSKNAAGNAGDVQVEAQHGQHNWRPDPLD